MTMKKISSLTLLLLMVCLTYGQSKDEMEIRKLEKKWTKLLDEGDTAALLDIWSPDYVVNNTKGKIVTPKEIVALMENGHTFPKVKRIIERITFNDNVAVVMGKDYAHFSKVFKVKTGTTPTDFRKKYKSSVS